MSFSWHPIQRASRAAQRAVIDFILPPLCLRCREPVRDPQSVCSTCWQGLRFITAPQCVQCGLPFPYALGEGVKCGACLARPPAFATARSALAYDDISRDLILAFKHADRLEGASLFARWMVQSSGTTLCDAHVIVPVPLYWQRLLIRKYNQAAVLARDLGRILVVPVDGTILTRPAPSRSQGEMHSARARLKNVTGSFKVSKANEARIAGRKVILVDDVLTTGATVTACSKALLKGGAAHVAVVTLARVLRPLSLSL